jgi:hypothetical protein
MKNITGIDARVLKKYDRGGLIDPKDEFYIERMVTTGLMTKGYDLENDRMTARTTRLGRSSIGSLLDDGDNYIKCLLRDLKSKMVSFYHEILK